MSFSSVWDILSGRSLPALPSCSQSDPASSVSPRSVCKSVSPSHSPRTPTLNAPPGSKPSMGPQFPDTQWSLNLRGSNPFSLCTRPPFWCLYHTGNPPLPLPPRLLASPPACPHCSVSWFCSHGFKRRQGWTDQCTPGLVFSVRLLNKPGQFLLHAPTSAGLDCDSWGVYNQLQIWYSNEGLFLNDRIANFSFASVPISLWLILDVFFIVCHYNEYQGEAQCFLPSKMQMTSTEMSHITVYCSAMTMVEVWLDLRKNYLLSYRQIAMMVKINQCWL